MKLFTKAIETKLINNFKLQQAHGENTIDFVPIVKLFTPDANCTWLLTELDEDLEYAFGLCDLGLGTPELGYVSIAELKSIHGKLGLPVERDKYFKTTKKLSALAAIAKQNNRITV